MKMVTFKRDTDAMGFGLFVAMLQNHKVPYRVTETGDHWIIILP